MNRNSPQICLVSASHLSSNPRMVKEADALHEAGYRVHVVAGRNFPPNDSLDASILSRAGWNCTVVDYHRGLRPAGQRLLRQLARRIVRQSPAAGLAWAARAHHPAAAQLAIAAARVPARLFIGHTLVGLYAAAQAANRRKSLLGFDAEDFHSLETAAASADPIESRAIRLLEQTLLPQCRHLTAAAPMIGSAYAATYGVREPATILNVFPLAEAPARPRAGGLFSVNQPARLYWVSQTIGPGRGLEPLLTILGKLHTPVTLSLRGCVNPDYASNLQALAAETGYGGKIEFLPPAPPAEMARLAAEHDLGLAIEPLEPENRHLCLSNKIFTYLLAGIPVAYTPTRAQLQLAGSLGPAAVLVDFTDVAGSANRLDHFLANPVGQHAARTEAWRLGHERYNWDFEKRALLAAVAASLA